MSSTLKILAIVPAFNEEESITKVIEDLHSFNNSWDILIVNDGSTDKTSKVAKTTQKAIVLDLVNNLGIGGAVQTGFKYAARYDYDIAFQFDGDGQHIASEAAKCVEIISSGKADLAIGSRFIKKHTGWKSSPIRRFGIIIFQVLNSILIGQKVTDNTSGLRAYSKEAIHFLANNYPLDYPEPEAVILLGRNGFKIKEVFTNMKARYGGTSSISLRKGVYYMIKVILSILISSIKPKIR